MPADSSDVALLDPSPNNSPNNSLNNLEALPHQIFHGTTWHSRLLPNVHKFAYPYRYWGVNITALAAGQALPEVALLIAAPTKNNRSLKSKLANSLLLNHRVLKGLLLFSAQHKAVQQFCASDYLQALDKDDNENGDKGSSSNEFKAQSFKAKSFQAGSLQSANEQLLGRLNEAFIAQTDSAPTGEIIGMLVCRNAGIYFSPVNFYLGFDSAHNPSHLLAEVSNTPWDKRHYYGFLLDGVDSEFCHDKDFHVSPFNPVDQLYRWQVKVNRQQDNLLRDGLDIRIAIDISDARGEVLKTGIKMTSVPMTAEAIRQSMRENPLINLTSLTRIYWHAFKLYAIKKVPYVGYDEKLADSKQNTSQ